MKPNPRAGLAFVLAMTLLGGASPAVAAGHGRLACGDTVTKSMRLTADLRDCPENGLVIGADGITLDLNGHRVDGDASRGGVGIDLEGHRGVTIANGTVRDFGEGVLVLGGRDVRILRVVSLDEEHGGILVDGGRDVTVTRSVV